MKRSIHILVGISGSGKTTFRDNLIRGLNYANTPYIIINRDSLRTSLFGDLTNYYKVSPQKLKEKENCVTELVAELIHLSEFEIEDYDVISDNTNLKLDYIDDLVCSFEDDSNVNIYLLEEDVEKCRQNVMKRDGLEYEDTLYILRQKTDFDKLIPLLEQRKYNLQWIKKLN